MIKQLFIGNKNNLTKKIAVWTILSGIVYALSSFIFFAVVTNIMGDVVAGVYSTGMAIAQQLLTIGKYSVRNYQVSDVTTKYDFSEYFTFRLMSCFLMVVGAFVWIAAKGYSGEEAVVIFSFSIYKMAECISDVFEGLYQQKSRFDISGRTQFWKNCIAIATFLIMLLVTRNLAATCIVMAVVSLLLIIIVDFNIADEFSSIKFKMTFRTAKALVIACFPLFLSSFLYVYINNAPKLAINDIYGKEGMTRITALFMPVFAVDLLSGFTMRIWITRMARMNHDNDRKGFSKLVGLQMGVITVITAGSMLFMYFIGHRILSLIYDLDLSEYRLCLALLMLSGGMVATYTLFENIVLIYRHQAVSIWINIFSAGVSLVCMTTAAREYGITGATVAYLAVNALRALGYFTAAVIYRPKKAD